MAQALSAVLFFLVTLSAGGANATQTDDERIEHLMAMLTGDFDAGRHRHDERLAGIAEDKLSTWASRAFGPMEAPAISAHVMLSSSYNRYNGEWVFDPYEFLVWTVKAVANSDDILMTPKAPLGAESYKRSARIPGILDGIQPGGLVNGIGGAVCPIRWRKTEYGYHGTSKDCLVVSVSQKKMLNWNWDYVLRDDRLEIELAGRDKDTGEFLFGTAEGQPSYLYRLSDVSEYEAARYMATNPSKPEDLATAADLLREALTRHRNHAGMKTLLEEIEARVLN